ncbi:MAG: DUF5662 family protein [Oscillospiraceae bacterium]
MKWLSHLKTINHHKMLVMRHCFSCGLIAQGLLHDMSKYSPVEFWAGAKYYQGNQSPNNMERRERGYSAAWLHHKGKNKHHLEYWIDYSPFVPHELCGMEMPVRYVAEMVCDRIAASKTYNPENYKDEYPYTYYSNSRDHLMLHPNTRALLEQLLMMLRDKGETETFNFIKNEIVRKNRNPFKTSTPEKILLTK